MKKNILNKKMTRIGLDEFIERNAVKGKMLNVGGARGRYGEYFDEMVNIDIEDRPGVDVVADAHNLPFDDNSFDAVLAVEVLEHLYDPHMAVSEMYRVLKPGGRVILTTRFLYPLHDTPHDYFRYTHYGLKHLFNDWDIKEFIPDNSTQKTLAALMFSYARQSEFKGGMITKGLVYACARIIWLLPKLSRAEYSKRRIKKVIEEDNIMATGYYLSAEKKKN